MFLFPCNLQSHNSWGQKARGKSWKMLKKIKPPSWNCLLKYFLFILVDSCCHSDRYQQALAQLCGSCGSIFWKLRVKCSAYFYSYETIRKLLLRPMSHKQYFALDISIKKIKLTFCRCLWSANFVLHFQTTGFYRKYHV